MVCHRATLDGDHAELTVYAESLMSDEMRVMYAFSVTVGEEKIVTGRATVVLDISNLAP